MELNHLILKPFISVLAISAVWMAPACAGDDSLSEGFPRILSQGTVESQDFLPDFSYAGYRNGAEELQTPSAKVIQVDEFGARADDQADDTKSIIVAIAQAQRKSSAASPWFAEV